MKNRFLVLLLISAYCSGDIRELEEEMSKLKTRLEKVEKKSLQLDVQLNEPSWPKIVGKVGTATVLTLTCAYCIPLIVKGEKDSRRTESLATTIFLGVFSYMLGKSAYNDYQKKIEYAKLFDKST